MSHDTIKHQNDEVAQAVYRGLQKLGLELSDSEAERIAKNDTGMMPMERFLEEACDLKYIAGVDANTDGEVAKKPEERKE